MKRATGAGFRRHVLQRRIYGERRRGFANFALWMYRNGEFPFRAGFNGCYDYMEDARCDEGDMQLFVDLWRSYESLLREPERDAE